MIAPEKNSNAHLASAWTAGIACLFLGIGISGAVAPLMPEIRTEVLTMDGGDEIMLEEFRAASAPADNVPEETSGEEDVIEDVEIPPLLEITPPLTVSEMMELTPLQPFVEKPKPAPAAKPPETKPRPAPARPVTKSRSQGAAQGNGGGGSGTVQLFTAGGSGRYPSPYYPASARAAGKQGSLRLLVTVEASGVPSSVTVTSSSGHSVLDSAARDHVQRRWRWPSGPVRRYIVPIKFVLQ